MQRFLPSKIVARWLLVAFEALSPAAGLAPLALFLKTAHATDLLLACFGFVIAFRDQEKFARGVYMAARAGCHGTSGLDLRAMRRSVCQFRGLRRGLWSILAD